MWDKRSETFQVLIRDEKFLFLFQHYSKQLLLSVRNLILKRNLSRNYSKLENIFSEIKIKIFKIAFSFKCKSSIKLVSIVSSSSLSFKSFCGWKFWHLSIYITVWKFGVKKRSPSSSSSSSSREKRTYWLFYNVWNYWYFNLLFSDSKCRQSQWQKVRFLNNTRNGKIERRINCEVNKPQKNE
jgi:hypothetical protein